MEHVAYVLFALHGRINRITWLVYFVALAVAESLAVHLFRQLFDMPDPGIGGTALADFGGDSVTLLADLIFLWPSVALDVKRWHDMGRSGWYALIASGPALALEVLAVSGIAVPDRTATFLVSAAAAIALVYFIFLAAGKGTARANRFGPA